MTVLPCFQNEEVIIYCSDKQLLLSYTNKLAQSKTWRESNHY